MLYAPLLLPNAGPQPGGLSGGQSRMGGFAPLTPDGQRGCAGPHPQGVTPLRRVGGATGKADLTGAHTMTAPVHVGVDGWAVIFSVRSSTGNAITSITDTGGATWVELVNHIPNSSSRNVAYVAPFTSAMSGATITVTWTGANNTASALEVWEGDGVIPQGPLLGTNAGTTFTVGEWQPPADVFAVLVMIGARGAADGSQPLLDTASIPAPFGDPQTISSVSVTPAQNSYVGVVSTVVQDGSGLAPGAALPTTILGNNRGGMSVVIYGAPPVASGGATVNATAGSMSLPSASHTVTGGAVVTETATGMSLPSASHTVTGGAQVTETATGMALPSTAPTIMGGAVVNATAGAMALPSTAPTITAGAGGVTVNATAGSMALPSASHTVVGGANVGATAGQMALPSTSHTVTGGGRVTGVAGSMNLPSTTHTGIGGAVVGATAGQMLLPSTVVQVDLTYFAIAAQMVLGTTSPTITVTPAGAATVVAVAAPMLLPSTAPEARGGALVVAGAAGMLLGLTYPQAVLTGQPARFLYLLGVGTVQHRMRTPHPLWSHYAPPPLSKVVLLYRDGQVVEVEDPSDYASDAYLQNGNLVEEGSWQASVLLAAGYVLVEAP